MRLTPAKVVVVFLGGGDRKEAESYWWEFLFSKWRTPVLGGLAYRETKRKRNPVLGLPLSYEANLNSPFLKMELTSNEGLQFGWCFKANQKDNHLDCAEKSNQTNLIYQVDLHKQTKRSSQLQKRG